MKTNRGIGAISFALCAAAVLVVGPAAAKEVRLEGTYTRAEIKAACDKVGGLAGGTEASSGTYDCYNLRKGTYVACDDGGRCTGWLPLTQGVDARPASAPDAKFTGQEP